MRHFWLVAWVALSGAGCGVSQDVRLGDGGVSPATAPNAGAGAEVHCHQNESQCLTQLQRLAQRSGDMLTLQLENGKTKTFKSETRGCKEENPNKCARYQLIAYLPSRHAFGVSASYYEETEFILVSSRAGHVTKLDWEPHFSPTGKRFVAVGEANPMRRAPKDIVIYSAETDPPRLEWSHDAGNALALYSFAGWDGDDRVRLRVGMRVGNEAKELDADAVHINGGWRLSEADSR